MKIYYSAMLVVMLAPAVVAAAPQGAPPSPSGAVGSYGSSRSNLRIISLNDYARMSEKERAQGYYVIDPDLDAFRAAENDAAELTEQARVAAAKGSLAEAETLFRRAINEDRSWARAWPDLARVLEQEGKYAEAMEVCRQLVFGDDRRAAERAAFAGHPIRRDYQMLYGPVLTATNDPTIRMRYALCLLRAGRGREAVFIYNETLRAHARHKAMEQRMLDECRMASKASKDPAVRAYSDTFASQTPTRSLLDSLAEMDQNGWRAEALEANARLIVGIPEVGQGAGLDPLGFKEGREYIARAIKLEPESALANKAYGRLLETEGRLPEALAAYGRAVELAVADSSLKADAELDYRRVNLYLPHPTVVIHGRTP